MALYKVGDRILSQEEYEDDKIQKWGLVLFVMGAVFGGIAAHASIPADWAKAVKFALIIASGIASGAVLAYFAKQVETLFWWTVLLGFLFVIGYVVWKLV